MISRSRLAELFAAIGFGRGWPAAAARRRTASAALAVCPFRPFPIGTPPLRRRGQGAVVEAVAVRHHDQEPALVEERELLAEAHASGASR